jgi:hypothetical protein
MGNCTNAKNQNRMRKSYEQYPHDIGLFHAKE